MSLSLSGTEPGFSGASARSLVAMLKERENGKYRERETVVKRERKRQIKREREKKD
jgi:hypothetical protein